MQKYVNDLTELLKGFIHESRPYLKEPVDWRRVFQVARANSISGIVGYMIARYDLSESEEIINTAYLECGRTAGMSIRRISQAQRLIEQLKEHQISILLTKGIVIRDYYPEPTLRTFGDIDFLVHKEDRNTVHQLMKDLGYKVKTDWEPVYSYIRDTEYYEIHTELMDIDIKNETRTIEFFKDAWNHSDCIDEYVYVPSIEYHFIYLLVHLAKHIITGGAGIRMFADIAVYIQRNASSMDWDYICRQLSNLELNQFADFLFSSIEKWFDIGCPDHRDVDPEILDQLLTSSLEGGTFGRDTSDPASDKLKAYSRNNHKISKAGALISMAFPSAETLQGRYTYLKNRHWLLPAAWIHRLITNRKKIGFETAKATHIIKADVMKIDETNQILTRIGLK